VIALASFFVVSATLTALIVIELDAGSVAGAVYFPAVSMLPRAAEPPTVSLTDQVTEVLALPVTAAAKVSEAPARIFAVAGVTETETAAGGGGGGFCVDKDVEPQPTSRSARPTSRRMWRSETGSLCIQVKLSRVPGRETTGRRARKRAGCGYMGSIIVRPALVRNLAH
jgi:hypothetical protein